MSSHGWGREALKVVRLASQSGERVSWARSARSYNQKLTNVPCPTSEVRVEDSLFTLIITIASRINTTTDPGRAGVPVPDSRSLRP